MTDERIKLLTSLEEEGKTRKLIVARTPHIMFVLCELVASAFHIREGGRGEIYIGKSLVPVGIQNRD